MCVAMCLYYNRMYMKHELKHYLTNTKHLHIHASTYNNYFHLGATQRLMSEHWNIFGSQDIMGFMKSAILSIIHGRSRV